MLRAILFALAGILPSAANALPESEGCNSCGRGCGIFAVKTNLLHDAVLTPDLGLELVLPRNFSISVEGVYAWWSRRRSNRYWRIRGAWLDVNYWFGPASRSRTLTGHHAGIYGSCHDFDFEFGGTGWQAPRATFGVGLSYGYSFRLKSRLNLDVGIRVGYWSGRVTKYRPECGRYVCIDRYRKHYFGLTGISVTLVWFPGSGNFNNPGR